MQFQSSFKKKYNSELSIYRLVNKYFWKSLVGPISTISLPLLFMIIYKIIGGSNIQPFTEGFASYISLSVLPLTLITFPQLLVEFKTSIVLRKISNSDITAFKFCLIILSYYLVALICSNILIITLYATFLNVDAPVVFKKINWGQLIYALLNIYLISLSTGLLMGVLTKKGNIIQLLGFSLTLVSITFSGQFIPLEVIMTNNAMKYISLFSPISYGLNQLNIILITTNIDLSTISSVPESGITPEMIKLCYINNIFDINNGFSIIDFTNVNGNILIKTIAKIYEPWQKIMILVMPYVFSSIFMIVSIKRFNWTSR